MLISRHSMILMVFSIFFGFIFCALVSYSCAHYSGKIREDIKFKEKQSVESDLSGLFGINLTRDYPPSRCSDQPPYLNGFVERNGDALLIVSASPQVYRPDDLFEERYPIVTYSPSQLLIRQDGHYRLLCSSKKNNSKVAPVVKRLLKPINNSYFSLMPISNNEQRAIGYSIGRCNYRCKILLASIGLQDGDVLLSINAQPIVETDTLVMLKQLARTGDRIVVSLIRNKKEMTIELKNMDVLAKLESN